MRIDQVEPDSKRFHETSGRIAIGFSAFPIN
jgi:hypothetical protein